YNINPIFLCVELDCLQNGNYSIVACVMYGVLFDSSGHLLLTIILLQITITVCSQMGSLGISIAGGKGSSPYKENDEAILIARVAKVGPVDLTGVQGGDKVLEVESFIC
ncbi:scribbled planar cell polarity, partial [Chelydra serpentina]